MNGQLIQLLVLAAIAIFLILRLRSVLGTRDGFEEPRAGQRQSSASQPTLEVIDGGADADIADNVDPDSPSADALREMKSVEPDFSVSEFIGGARGAYEMILMAFENGSLSDIRGFLADDVHDAFASVVDARREQGLTVEASFIGVRETTVADARFDQGTGTAEIDIRFIGEMTSVVRDNGGDIVEGDPSEIKRQRDTWTFARVMGSDDPNWQLVATGD